MAGCGGTALGGAELGNTNRRAELQVHMRPMKRKWASMSTSGRLTLDALLLKLPKELGEFVIVHELVHRLAPNHGKVFKSFMLAYLPDWEERDARLQRKVKSGR